MNKKEVKQLLLLVDKNDNFKGKYAGRQECHMGKGLHHRAFVVVLYNEKNEILLQKRKHELWDDFWDISATSHVLHLADHNESYEEAINRCIKRELGVDEVKLEKMGGFNYFVIENKYCENEYCAVFLGKYNGFLSPNTDVMYEYTYKSFKDILWEIKNKPALYTPWSIYTFQLLQKERFLQ